MWKMSDREPEEISDWFWTLIERSDGSRAKLSEVLSDLTKEDLIRFAREFEEAAVELTGEPYTDYMKGQSDDDVEDVARWIVSRGRETYRSVIERPELTPHEVPANPPTLHGVAQAVFHSRYQDAMPAEVYM